MCRSEERILYRDDGVSLTLCRIVSYLDTVCARACGFAGADFCAVCAWCLEGPAR